MKYIKLLSSFLFLSTFIVAQDSSRVNNQKVLTHEIGFNTVSLIKQLISNNPSSTLAQLPYDVFYNLYYKNKIGARVGLGINTSHSQSDIEGQQTPRTTNRNTINLRVGASYNFVRSRRLTLNCFADFVSENISLKTANTTTAQSFPDPIQNITVTTNDVTKGVGAQVGVGVKYNFTRHLSIYAEVPFTFISEKITSTVNVNDTGTSTQTITTTKNFNTQIILPTTVYLVLRF